MVLDNKVFALSIIYSILTIFFVVVIIIPFRVVYQFQSLGYYYWRYYDYSYFLLIPENLRIIMSRGFALFVAGLVSFVISMFCFLKFSNDGSPKFAKTGYFFGLCSGILLILSVVTNYVVYNNRIISYAPLIITIAISITLINIGTLIFIKRNDLEVSIPKPVKKITGIVEEKKIKPITSPIIKTILTSQETPTETQKDLQYCPYCGNKVEIDHKFCRKCGRRIK